MNPLPGGRNHFERFNRRAIRAGLMPFDIPTVDRVAERADEAIFGAIVQDRKYVLHVHRLCDPIRTASTPPIRSLWQTKTTENCSQD